MKRKHSKTLELRVLMRSWKMIKAHTNILLLDYHKDNVPESTRNVLKALNDTWDVDNVEVKKKWEKLMKK